MRAIFLFLVAIPTIAYPAVRFTADNQNLRVRHLSIINLGLPVQDLPVRPGDEGFLHNTDFTIEAWIKPSAAARNQSYKFIVSKNFNGTGYALLMIGSDQEQRIQFESDSIAAYGMNEGYNERAFRNQWFHIAGVSKGNKLFIYFNGILAAEATKPGPARANDLPLWIGSSPWESFRGDIAEVRLWRTARTHPEIVHFMNQKLSGNEDSLAAYYPLQNNFENRTFFQTIRNKELDAAPQEVAPTFVPGPPLAPPTNEIAARAPRINIEINGEKIKFSPGAEPFILNGRAYAAVCTISYHIGLYMGRYNGIRHRIELESPPAKDRIAGQPLTLTGEILVGALTATLDGKTYELPAPAMIIDRSTPTRQQNETYFPLTFVTNYLGHQTKWIESTKTVQITTKTK